MIASSREPGWRNAGFTLIELMVTIAIAAVLMTLAAPSFVSFLRNSELTSTTNSLVAAIGAARTEAMKRNFSAFVQPKSGGWISGWVVYADLNDNDVYDAAVDYLVLDQPALPSYFSVSGSGTANGSSPYVRYNSSGYPVNTSDAFGALTFSLTRNDLSGSAVLEQTRRVKIAKTGRVRTCKPLSSSDTECSESGNE
ncbi:MULTISPECIES: GspH/FimT family pseudopilin [unclassified Acidovorax]|uniref:GspH/FimT family pseudopilin n=1 Tax=unclassified Acidovorax TaxID=2684926 RepID=UPI002883198C|nr:MULTISPECIES: GspH/FimT family pseudopilin [unclassified Acidovorax]